MDQALLIELGWKSLATSGAALALLHLLRGRTPAERSWIAHAGLVATALLPLAVLSIPAWSIEAPAAMPAALVHAAPAIGPAIAPAPALSLPAVTEPDRSPASVLGLAYAVPAILLLLLMLVAVARLFALRARAAVLVEARWLSALSNAQRRMGFRQSTALLVSAELSSPVSWGMLRPIILLNAETVRSPREAEAIIAHELAHVARLDWAKLLIARVVTAIFWFNPLVWKLAAECHQLREEAADDAVLRHDVDDADYAALLVNAARHQNNALLLAAHGVAPGRHALKRRIVRVLDRGLSRAPARRRWALLCSVAAVLLSAPLAALTPVAPVLPRALVLAHSSAVAPIRPAPAERGVPAPPRPTDVAGELPSLAGSITATVNASLNASLPHHAAAPMPAPLPRPVPRPHPAKEGNRDEIAGYAARLADAHARLSNLSDGELSKLRALDVDPDAIRELVALGYRFASDRDIVNVAVHDVTPAYAREMAAAGYTDVQIGDLVKLRIFGVSPDDARAVRRSGNDSPSAKDLVRIRISGRGSADFNPALGRDHDFEPDG